MSDEWGGLSDDGTSWKVELEADTFNAEDGMVVSLYLENIHDGLGPLSERRKCGLAEMSAHDARELAAALMRVAGHVERARMK